MTPSPLAAMQAPTAGSADPAESPTQPPRSSLFLRLRTILSASPTVLAYVALLAIPFIDVDPWCHAVGSTLTLTLGWVITGGLHRYFSHRSYKTSRAVQFLIAVLGCLALQKGPLWWAAKHRDHHRHSDEEGDPHSPILSGFWHSHMGWLYAPRQLQVDRDLIKDLTRYPELVWLDRLWMVPGMLFGVGCYLALGWGGVVVGYATPVAILYQVTFLINSVGHLSGPRRFETKDRSRNNFVLGYLAMGEGWHNNHHRAPYSARSGFAWYELDVCYAVIRLLAWVGLVWDVKLAAPELMKGDEPPRSEPIQPPAAAPEAHPAEVPRKSA